MRIMRAAAAGLAVAIVPAVFSCQKDDREAEKFERADQTTFRRDMSDLSSFTLENGITVYLQEEHTTDQIAIEVFYPVGFMDEPAGRPQLSHVTEHLTMYCATSAFGSEEAYKLLTSDRGMVNAEVLGDFIHFDYIVRGARFEEALRVEAARLGGMSCDASIMKREQAKVIDEIDKTLASTKPALTKFAMMALNQAMNHGRTQVDIREGTMQVTIEEVQRFQQEYFRPDDMVIILIGDFAKADAEALVRKHFESIPRRSAPPAPTPKLARDIRATWDVKASAIYYIAPGPYAGYRERLMLSMFGSFLHQYLNATPELYSGNQTIYTTNQVYRVGDLPFFLYAQPTGGRTVGELGPLLLEHLERAVAMLDDDARIDAIKGATASFATSSMLKPDVSDYPMAHHQVIGQEALNVGIRHFLREGRSTDEFLAEVNGITADEFRRVVKSHLERSKLFEVSFVPAR
jgi:predicted Zn-dependent peptidase